MKTIIACLIVVLSCAATRADELNDMPEIACAQASSAVERAQIGCPGASNTGAESRTASSPLDRAEDN